MISIFDIIKRMAFFKNYFQFVNFFLTSYFDNRSSSSSLPIDYRLNHIAIKAQSHVYIYEHTPTYVHTYIIIIIHLPLVFIGHNTKTRLYAL